MGEVKEPLIDKTFVSIGPCYAETIFNFFKPLFRYSISIRLNLPEKLPAIKKIAELFNDTEPDSMVIVIMRDEFSVIEDALNYKQ